MADRQSKVNSDFYVTFGSDASSFVSNLKKQLAEARGEIKAFKDDLASIRDVDIARVAKIRDVRTGSPAGRSEGGGNAVDRDLVDGIRESGRNFQLQMDSILANVGRLNQVVEALHVVGGRLNDEQRRRRDSETARDRYERAAISRDPRTGRFSKSGVPAGEGRASGKAGAVTIAGTPKVLVEEAAFQRVVDAVGRNVKATKRVGDSVDRGVAKIVAAVNSIRVVSSGPGSGPANTRPPTPDQEAAFTRVAQLRSQIAQRKRLTALEEARSLMRADKPVPGALVKAAAASSDDLRRAISPVTGEGKRNPARVREAILDLRNKLAEAQVPEIEELETELQAAIAATGTADGRRPAGSKYARDLAAKRKAASEANKAAAAAERERQSKLTAEQRRAEKDAKAQAARDQAAQLRARQTFLEQFNTPELREAGLASVQAQEAQIKEARKKLAAAFPKDDLARRASEIAKLQNEIESRNAQLSIEGVDNKAAIRKQIKYREGRITDLRQPLDMLGHADASLRQLELQRQALSEPIDPSEVERLTDRIAALEARAEKLAKPTRAERKAARQPTIEANRKRSELTQSQRADIQSDIDLAGDMPELRNLVRRHEMTQKDLRRILTTFRGELPEARDNLHFTSKTTNAQFLDMIERARSIYDLGGGATEHDLSVREGVKPTKVSRKVRLLLGDFAEKLQDEKEKIAQDILAENFNTGAESRRASAKGRPIRPGSGAAFGGRGDDVVAAARNYLQQRYNIDLPKQALELVRNHLAKNPGFNPYASEFDEGIQGDSQTARDLRRALARVRTATTALDKFTRYTDASGAPAAGARAREEARERFEAERQERAERAALRRATARDVSEASIAADFGKQTSLGAGLNKANFHQLLPGLDVRGGKLVNAGELEQPRFDKIKKAYNKYRRALQQERRAAQEVLEAGITESGESGASQEQLDTHDQAILRRMKLRESLLRTYQAQTGTRLNTYKIRPEDLNNPALGEGKTFLEYSSRSQQAAVERSLKASKAAEFADPAVRLARAEGIQDLLSRITDSLSAGGKGAFKQHVGDKVKNAAQDLADSMAATIKDARKVVGRAGASVKRYQRELAKLDEQGINAPAGKRAEYTEKLAAAQGRRVGAQAELDRLLGLREAVSTTTLSKEVIRRDSPEQIARMRAVRDAAADKLAAQLGKQIEQYQGELAKLRIERDDIDMRSAGPDSPDYIPPLLRQDLFREIGQRRADYEAKVKELEVRRRAALATKGDPIVGGSRSTVPIGTVRELLPIVQNLKRASEENVAWARKAAGAAANGGGGGGGAEPPTGTAGPSASEPGPNRDVLEQILAAIKAVHGTIKEGVKFRRTGSERTTKSESTEPSTTVAKPRKSSGTGAFQFGTPEGRKAFIGSLPEDVQRLIASENKLAAATRLVQDGMSQTSALAFFRSELNQTADEAKEFEKSLRGVLGDAQLTKAGELAAAKAARDQEVAKAEQLGREADSRNQTRRQQVLGETMGRVSEAAKKEVVELRALTRAGADQAAIAAQQVRVYQALDAELSKPVRVGGALQPALAGGARRRRIQTVLSDAAGSSIKTDEFNNIARVAGLSSAKTSDAARRSGGVFGADMGLAAQGAFERAFFGNHGFWSRVLNSTGTFVVRNFSAALVFGLTAALRNAIETGIQTESTFVQVSQALEQTGRSVDGLRSGLGELSQDYGVALKDVYETAAGLTGLFDASDVGNKKLLALTEVAVQLEMISRGALSATEAMKSLSSVTSAFTDVTPEHIADVATVIQNRLGVNIEETIEGVARLSGQARQLGISFESIATYVAAVSKFTGQTGAGAGEQLSRILASLQTGKTQTTLSKAFGNHGIDIESALNVGDYQKALQTLLSGYDKLSKAERDRVANALGGQRQAASVNALLLKGGDVLNTVTQAENSNGAAAERARQIADQLANEIKRLGIGFENFFQILVRSGGLGILQTGLKGLLTVVDGINSALNKLNDLMEATPVTRALRDWGLTLAGAAVGIKLVQRGWAGLTAVFNSSRGLMDRLTGRGAAGEVGEVAELTAVQRRERELRKIYGSSILGGLAMRAGQRAGREASATGTGPMGPFTPGVGAALLAPRNFGPRGRLDAEGNLLLSESGQAAGGPLRQFYQNRSLGLQERAIQRQARADMLAHRAAMLREVAATRELTLSERTLLASRLAGARANAMMARTNDALSRGMALMSRHPVLATAGSIAAIVAITDVINTLANRAQAFKDVKKVYDDYFGSGSQSAAQNDDSNAAKAATGYQKVIEDTNDRLGGGVGGFKNWLEESLFSGRGINSEIFDAMSDQLYDRGQEALFKVTRAKSPEEAQKQFAEQSKNLKDWMAQVQNLPLNPEDIARINGYYAHLLDAMQNSAVAVQAHVEGMKSILTSDQIRSLQDLAPKLQGLGPTAANNTSTIALALKSVYGFRDEDQSAILGMISKKQGPSLLGSAGIMPTNVEKLRSLQKIQDREVESARVRFETLANNPESDDEDRQNAWNDLLNAWSGAEQTAQQIIQAQLQGIQNVVDHAKVVGDTKGIIAGFQQQLAVLKQAAAAGRIDPDDYQAQVDQAQAQVVAALTEQSDEKTKAAERGNRNDVEIAELELQAANQQLEYAKKYGNHQLVEQALDRQDKAKKELEDRQDELASAIAQTNVERLPQGDALGRAQAKFRIAADNAKRIAQKFGTNSTQYQQAIQEVLSSQRAVSQAIQDISAANSQLSVAYAQATGDAVAVANAQLGVSQDALSNARQKAGGGDMLDSWARANARNSPDVINAQTQVVNDQNSVQQALDARTDSYYSLLEAQASATGNNIAALNQQLADQQAKLGRLLSRAGGPTDQTYALEAQIAQTQKQIRDALGDRDDSYLAIVEAQAQSIGDNVGANAAQLAQLKSKLQRLLSASGGVNTTEINQLRAQIIQTEAAGRDARNALLNSFTDMAIATADAAGNTVEAARLQLSQAQTRLAQLQAAAGGVDTEGINQAKAEVTRAQAAYRDAQYQNQMDTVDFQLQMGQITSNEAIKVLQGMLRATDLTEQERRQIMLKIHGLQSDIRNSLTASGFNIPTEIKLPTPYEVRRSLGVDKYAGLVKDSMTRMRDAMSGAPTPGNVGSTGRDAAMQTIAGVLKSLNDNPRTLVQQDVDITQQVSTPAMIETIAKRVVDLLNSQAQSAVRANKTTPSLVRV